jgi:hypothetical protein
MQTDSFEVAPLDRSLWTNAQRLVFEDALNGHRLIDIVNSWTAPTADATDLGRKILHVPPLAVAAASLMRAGIVELVREEAPLDVVAQDVALGIVSNPLNWWPRVNEEEEEEKGLEQDDGRADPSVEYCLITTPFGEALPLPRR